MNMNIAIVLIALFAIIVSAKDAYFKEEFGSGWENRWVESSWKEAEGQKGKFAWSAGKYFGDAEADKGIQTSTDARFYAISSKLPKKFSNKGKDLVIQYTVKHEQHIDCGGAYIKLLPSNLDQQTFNGDAEYNIMFGPDICGSSTKKVHLIFNYKGQNHLIKKNVPCESDEHTHLYTMILHPDNTYEIEIDQKEVAQGSLKEDWDLLAPKEIKDPKAKKPSDWVDEKVIPDPEDQKPEGWDDIPAQITDPEADKPEDWDEDLDGEWEAPTISNPEYKGEWSPKTIPNPEYKGEWVHPMIPNPDYVDDDELYLFSDNAFVGFELWQVKAGTIFDNILVTDSVSEANEHAEKTWAKTVKGEKKAKEDEEAQKKAEADAKKDDGDDDDEDDDDDDDDDDDHHDHDHKHKDEL